MRQPPPTPIIHYPTPRPGNNPPLKRPTEKAKQKQQHKTHRQNRPKRPPVALHRELDARELDREVARHERDGHEDDGDLGEEEGDAGEALDAEGFFDGDEVEILGI